jgi:hypothetical protein
MSASLPTAHVGIVATGLGAVALTRAARELGKPNTLLAPVARIVKTKRRCCKSNPRCKRCPVVCKRLEKAGVAERVDLRVYKVAGTVTKKQLKAVRAR